jgi:sulfur transfer protein SufE
MRMRLSLRVLGVALGLAALVAWGAPPALAANPSLTVRDTEASPSAGSTTKTPQAPAAKPNETPAERMQRLVTTAQDQLAALQNEEVKLSLNEEKIVGAAAANVTRLNNAADDLYHNNTKDNKGLPEYKQAIVYMVGQWQQMADKYTRLYNMVKGLEKDKDKAAEDLVPAIDQLVSRLTEKQRSLLEKLADLCEKSGDYRSAVAYDLKILNSVAKEKQKEEKKLITKIGDLYLKMDDAKNAYTTFKTLYDASPDVHTGFKVADALDKAKDYKGEVAFLKILQKDFPDENGIQNHINDAQKKITTNAKPGQPATGNTAGPWNR